MTDRKAIPLDAKALADEFEKNVRDQTGLMHFYRWGEEWRTVIAALRAYTRPEGGEIHLAEIRFDSDCVFNGVKVSAGTKLTFHVAGKLPGLLEPAA